ncbi:tetratricopeptide repeat protein [Undibacterium griseum]|uniref:Sel1 repeat family protein n=1 Tax=Undibacterium griseum TaxID=2762295 RepID=A0ABR6YRR8_9BURK|nr:tetratricopeptide repeat protein [Undibacterium griseum]MBC3886581.1 sel1 repeat family protein [Undibacterium griseum]
MAAPVAIQSCSPSHKAAKASHSGYNKTISPIAFFPASLPIMPIRPFQISSALLFAVSLLCQPVRAGDFEDGVSLYEQEEFSAAAEAFQAAASKGHADAQFNLGLMYLNGEGVPEDYRRARELFEQSAAQNNVRAQVNLARIYAKGKGVAPDYGKAVSWFKKAADQGYADAQYSLGVLYVTGNGVAPDYRKARELFQQAADQHNASAQYQLGLMYFKGRGVAVNLVEAYKWLLLAEDYDDAAVYRSYVARSMSAEQISEATTRAKEWTASGQ